MPVLLLTTIQTTENLSALLVLLRKCHPSGTILWRGTSFSHTDPRLKNQKSSVYQKTFEMLGECDVKSRQKCCVSRKNPV